MAFIERLAQRRENLDTLSGPDVAAAQLAAFREWEQSTGTRFGDLKGIHQPTLVVNGIPRRNDSRLELLSVSRESSERRNFAYPDSGHGSLFQFHESFTHHAAAFLASDAPFAPDRERVSQMRLSWARACARQRRTMPGLSRHEPPRCGSATILTQGEAWARNRRRDGQEACRRRTQSDQHPIGRCWH